MDPIERLAEMFEKFPGIGPRQANRFVHYLLRTSAAHRRELAEGIERLSGSVVQCPECKRWHAGAARAACSLCARTDRDNSLLVVVASDADLLAFERSGSYRGRYFVVGGTISLASESLKDLRIRDLLELLERRVSASPVLSEVILAFPANPEGDMTAVRLREEVLAEHAGLRVTTLGRGLSTGSELEYADPATIHAAFENRR